MVFYYNSNNIKLLKIPNYFHIKMKNDKISRMESWIYQKGFIFNELYVKMNKFIRNYEIFKIIKLE